MLYEPRPHTPQDKVDLFLVNVAPFPIVAEPMEGVDILREEPILIGILFAAMKDFNPTANVTEIVGMEDYFLSKPYPHCPHVTPPRTDWNENQTLPFKGNFNPLFARIHKPPDYFAASYQRNTTDSASFRRGGQEVKAGVALLP